MTDRELRKASTNSTVQMMGCSQLLHTQVCGYFPGLVFGMYRLLLSHWGKYQMLYTGAYKFPDLLTNEKESKEEACLRGRTVGRGICLISLLSVCLFRINRKLFLTREKETYNFPACVEKADCTRSNFEMKNGYREKRIRSWQSLSLPWHSSGQIGKRMLHICRMTTCLAFFLTNRWICSSFADVDY